MKKKKQLIKLTKLGQKRKRGKRWRWRWRFGVEEV